MVAEQDPARARQLAERAYGLAPESPAVLDTYGGLLLALFIGFVVSLGIRTPVRLDAIRDRNTLYREVAGGEIENVFRLKRLNLDTRSHRYEISVDGPEGLRLALASPVAGQGRLFHLEIQLHQGAITELAADGDTVSAQRTVPLPGCGLLQLQERRQIRTIPDAMREMPSVMVQKTGHGQGSPYIRGFTGLRTLFLIDGIRLNNSTFREGPNQYWNTVDPFSVHRLELVKGPSSVLYGSDAIGGTVNAISRNLDDFEPASGFSSRIALRGSTAENSYVVRPEVGYAGSSVDLYGGISAKAFGDLEAGGARQTGDHETVTAVVARAGQYRDTVRLGPAPLQLVECRPAGAFHQLKKLGCLALFAEAFGPERLISNSAFKIRFILENIGGT